MTNSRGRDSYSRTPYEGATGGYPGEAGRGRGEPGPYPRTREFDSAPRTPQFDPAPRTPQFDPAPRNREPDVREWGQRDGADRGLGVRDQGPDNRDPDGRGQAARPRSASRGPLSWWGTLSGGLGVCIVIGAALLGALGTVIMGREPGTLLGFFLVIGTIVAALVVHDRAAYLVIPVPALAYVAAAIMAGAIHDRAIDTDRTQLLVSAGQWIASGFVAITAATILAILITAVRWLLSRRRHPAEL